MLRGLTSVCKEDTEKKWSFLNFFLSDHNVELMILWPQDLDWTSTGSTVCLLEGKAVHQLVGHRDMLLLLCLPRQQIYRKVFQNFQLSSSRCYDWSYTLAPFCLQKTSFG